MPQLRLEPPGRLLELGAGALLGRLDLRLGLREARAAILDEASTPRSTRRLRAIVYAVASTDPEPNLAYVSGADNRFVLIDATGAASSRTSDASATPLDAFTPELPSDLAAHARELCARPGPDGRAWDGVLLLTPAASADAHVRLEIRNRDGSRPEACGNGLRCAAWYLIRAGIVAGEHARIETDAGVREVRLVERLANGRAALLLGSMGPARAFDPDPPVALEEGERAALAFDLGNPHLILRVTDERLADVARRGAALQAHPAFPHGVNVGFLATRGGRHHLRVFERGVGETAACGTNTCAAAACLSLREDLQLPLDIHLPGGPLRVEREGEELLLLGPAEIQDDSRRTG